MQIVPVRDAFLSSVALGEHGKPPAVLIHGLLFGNMATWYTSLAPQLAASHHVILYDQRGHGDSPVAATGYDMATQIEDLQAVLAHRGFDDAAVDVVGHSMGAVIALHFALHHPDRVRKLVIIDAPLPLERHVLPDLHVVNGPAVLDGFILERQGDAKGRRLERLQRRLHDLLFDSTLVSDLSALQEPDEREIRDLIPPTLLIYGRQSECLPAGEKLAGLLPNARFEVLESSHYVVEEAPTELRSLVLPFLAEGM